MIKYRTGPWSWRHSCPIEEIEIDHEDDLRRITND